MKAPRFGSVVMAAALASFILSQCSVVQKGAKVLGDTGKISEKDRDSIVKTSEAVRSTFSEITEQEEYYIGRAVSALILSRYKVHEDAGLREYVNVCGKTVSYSSDRPETFGGYHFLVLDTDEVNALAAPGGFVFVTKGLLKLCKDEEMLASILAHEIGHVAAKHGLQSIKKSRLVDAFKILGKEAATRYGPKELAELTEVFENALGDIVESLVEKGYDRKYEYEADRLAVKYAVATGYDPNGLTRFLKTMTGAPAAGGAKGWFKTHPSADDRLVKVNSQVKGMGTVPKTLDVRTARFLQAAKGLNP
ncbi:MAG TPA: M48 family metalloprotease [Acidobacteriota bacterium]|nr:M48 family metalloprotease [Acidobacteriota bacterium]